MKPRNCFSILLLFGLILQGLAQPTITIDQNSTVINNGDNFSFGTVSVDASQNFVFTITNTSSETLNISDISLSPNTYFTFFSPLASMSIAGGSSENFTVRFSADCNVTTQNAVLTIDNNSGTHPVYTVNLDADIVSISETANAGSNETICDTLYTLSATAPSSLTGEWSINTGGGTFNDVNSAISSVSDIPVGTNIYTWSLYEGTCLIDEDEVTITRESFPGPVNAGVDNIVCSNQSVSLVASTPSVGSGIWTKVNTSAIIQDVNAAITPVTNLSTDTNTFVWSVSKSSSTCPTLRDTVHIIRDENPTQAEAGTDKNICEDSYKLNANTPVVGSGTWSVISGSGTFENVNSDSSLVSGLTNGTNTYRWTIRSKYDFCSPSTDQVNIYRDIEPTIVNAGADITICEDTVSLDASPPDVGVGQWIVASGSSTVLEPMNPKSKVENLDNGTNTFIWVITSGSCTSSPDAVIVDRDDDLTPAESGDDQFLCKDSSTVMDANTPLKGFGQWSRTFGDAEIVNLTDPATEIKKLSIGRNTFVWTISSGTCTPSNDTIHIYRDGEAPEISCPEDITVQNDNSSCGAIVSFVEPIGTDNCPDAITSQIAGLSSGSLFPIGTTTNTFEVVDYYNYTATCSFDVVVSDTSLPVISCVDTIKQNNSLNDCGKIVSFTPPVGTDNCTGAVTTQTDGTGYTTGSFFPIGYTELEYTVNDASGNEASCSTVIAVLDVQKPTIDCPADISQDLTFGNCDAFITYPDPVIDDNCVNDELQFTQTTGLSGGNNFPAGVTTNTFIVTDSSGNTASCSFTVTINDVETPEITCPSDINTTNDAGVCGATVTYPDPAVNDICNNSTTSLIQGMASGNVFPIGTTTVTYEVVDEAGNTDACSFDISVNDTENPQINCPSTITQPVDAGLCEATVNYSSPTGNDNCTGFSISKIDVTGLSSGDNFPVGTTTLSYEITDASSNTSQCSFQVIIVDNEDPTITCPADIFVNNSPGICERQVLYTAPVGNDNCSIASTSQTDATGLSSGSLFPVGSTTLTYTTEDISGNTNSCSFTVNVLDNDPPTIACPNDTSVYVNSGFCSVNVNYFDPVVADLCGPTTFSLSSGKNKGAAFALGVHTITYEAFDTAGNTASCSFDISVLDTIKPSIACSNDITLSATIGNCSAPYTFNLPSATDNCDSIRVEQVEGPASGSNFPVGITEVAFIAYDSTGNKSDTCKINITVTDDEVPSITCVNDIYLDNTAGICERQVNFATPAVSDNCGILNTVQTDATGLSSGDVFPVGTTTLEYTTEDIHGNTNTCSFSVNIMDNDAPSINCPNDTTVYVNNGFCSVNVNYFDPIVTDLCGPATFSVIGGKSKGAAFALGEHTISYQASDTANNTASCSFEITVLDTIKPSIVCGNDVQLLTTTGNCSAVYNFPLPNANDNCDSIRVEQVVGPVSGSTFPLGTTRVAFVAYDSTGNKSDTCKINITVIDGEEPILTCPSDIVRCTEGIVNFPTASAVDNCTSGLVVNQDSGPTSGSSLTAGSYTVAFSTVDDFGNVGTCTMDIEVYDINIQPNAGNDTSICTSSTTLSGNTPPRTEIASWTTTSMEATISSPSSTSTTINSLTDGIYRFIYTFDRNSCGIQRDTIEVARNQNPGPAIAANDTTLCEVNSIILDAQDPGEGTGIWEVIHSAATVTTLSSTEARFDLLNTGENVLLWTVTNGLCPDVRDSVKVTVSENPSFSIAAVESVLFQEPVQFNVTANDTYSYEWQPAASFVDPFIANAQGAFEETTYAKLYATSGDGCTAIDSVEIIVLNELKIYTGFTPNDDNVNDVWVIRGIQAYPDARIEVFSQWGQPVYSSIGYNDPWDGKNEGKTLPFGPYYYVINLGNGEVKNGTVTLIR